MLPFHHFFLHFLLLFLLSQFTLKVQNFLIKGINLVDQFLLFFINVHAFLLPFYFLMHFDGLTKLLYFPVLLFNLVLHLLYFLCVDPLNFDPELLEFLLQVHILLDFIIKFFFNNLCIGT